MYTPLSVSRTGIPFERTGIQMESTTRIPFTVIHTLSSGGTISAVINKKKILEWRDGGKEDLGYVEHHRVRGPVGYISRFISAFLSNNYQTWLDLQFFFFY